LTTFALDSIERIIGFSPNNGLGILRYSNLKEGAMDITSLTALIALILAMSVASERLVEIVKGFVPSLSKESTDSAAEARRKAYLQLIAVLAGVVTAYLARNQISSLKELSGVPQTVAVLGLGLLASGGSGFWNAVLGYLTKAKEIKKAEAETAKAEAVVRKAEASTRVAAINAEAQKRVV
jgi:hypothetical protein